jgi:hypothetical protein
MHNRINVLWEVLLVVLVVTAIVIGVSNYRISKRIDRYHLQEQQVGIGGDQELTQTVATLETELNERMAYETRVERDPLDLTKVIQSKKFLARLGLRETLEQQGRMRLSCTVVGTDGSAVIKFMGRSHVVREGDVFNGYLVASITPQQVVLTKGGANLILMNESAPKDESSEIGGGGEGNF